MCTKGKINLVKFYFMHLLYKQYMYSIRLQTILRPIQVKSICQVSFLRAIYVLYTIYIYMKTVMRKGFMCILYSKNLSIFILFIILQLQKFSVFQQNTAYFPICTFEFNSRNKFQLKLYSYSIKKKEENLQGEARQYIMCRVE